MILSGLVSVTFRELSAEEIVQLVKKAGLEGIEWGGDIHVPHGNVKRASEVNRLTLDAGLQVAAYGSYYRTGVEKKEVGSFEGVLESAVALGAPTIRVWAGNKGSADADESWWSHVIEDTRRIATLAEQAGISICFEYHGNTLTDSSQSVLRLLKEVDHPNVYSLWQPPVGVERTECISRFKDVLPWVNNVHVYHWVGSERRPFVEGKENWEHYLQILSSKQQGEHFALMEFVKDNDPDQFLQDAKVLKELIEKIS